MTEDDACNFHVGTGLEIKYILQGQVQVFHNGQQNLILLQLSGLERKRKRKEETK